MKNHAPCSTRKRRAIAIVSAAALAVGGGLVGAAPASAWVDNVQCNDKGSGDQCWLNYNTPRRVIGVVVNTQYHRDQVCGKARNDVINGPVSPGSACTPGSADGIAVTFTYTSQLKKAYGYWAGNGGQIWVRINGGD